MGKRKIIVKQSAAFNIAKIAWFIESKGLVKTAEKFSDSIYDYFETLADNIVTHALCRDLKRRILGLKCVPYKKKYTVVFWESDNEIIITEFISSKMIY